MSTSKKPIKKRKRQSPLLSTTSRISQRLENLRHKQRNLWDDDDDDDDGDNNNSVEEPTESKTTPNNKTYIVLSDSDDEKTSSRQRSKHSRSRKKAPRILDENIPSDNDGKKSSKCVTCLICSILSTLTSYNCCSKHLSLLIHNKDSHYNHQKSTTDTNQWPPQQVMIVPMTDEFIQRYLNPQEIYRLKTQTSASPIYKKLAESNKSSRKLSKKSTITSEPSDTEHSNINKPKSSKKSSHIECEQSSSSSNRNESTLPKSGIIPSDVTFTILTSASTTINSFESPNVLDTCQLQQSSDQPIIIDDSQPDNQQENLLTNNNEKEQNNPWTPINDETYAAIEIVLNRIDQSSQEQTEFTPAIARRLPTELMASCLPKIQLKKGRFHQGKPITDKNTSQTEMNQSHSTTISRTSSSSSSSSSLTSVIITNTRPPTSLATIIEDESLIIQPTTYQGSNKSSQSNQILSDRHENLNEGLSDTVMSCLFAQDESSQHDNNHITIKAVSNEVLPPPAIITEDCCHENELNKSDDISHSSQLTNDLNDSQQIISSNVNEKTVTTTTTTPVRKSYRMNPDGSRISIVQSSNHQSPLTLLRRTSTDVNPITSHTNK